MESREATPEDAPSIRRVHEASIRGLGPDAYDDRQVDAWAAGCASADYAARIADAGEFVVAVDDRRGGSLDAVVGFGSLEHEFSAHESTGVTGTVVEVVNSIAGSD